MFLERVAIKIGWAVYKALSGAYKYAITQTFAIPTIDDSEKSKFTSNNDNNNDKSDLEEPVVAENGILNENKIDEILGNPDEKTFEDIFNLGKIAG